jgi:signal transduction histidine kinase
MNGGKGLFERALAANRTVTCDNCQEEDFSEVYRAYRLDQGIVVPFFRLETPVSVLGIFRQNGVPFSAAEIALLELFARQIGPLLFHRRRLNEFDTALRSRDEFLSIASHDLRNPLTALRGFTQLTARSIDKVPPDQPLPRANIQNNLQRIIKQTGSLDKLIGKLLDVSRINTGRLEIQTEPQELDELVAEAINRCRVAVATTETEENVPAEKRHAISLVIEDRGLAGEFDRERLSQVITNLIDNAVKYSPEGGTVRVKLCRAGDSFAELSVKDSGIGIPEEKQAVIFNRWSRINASSNGEVTTSGLGLGLFICREIVRKHNGQIFLESDPTLGTTFYVRLPIASRA